MALSKTVLVDFYNTLNENDSPYSLKAIKAPVTQQQAIQEEFTPRWRQRVNLAKSYVNNPNFDSIIQNIKVDFFETATSEKSKFQDFSLTNLQNSPIPYIYTPGKIDGAKYANGLGNPCCVIAGHPTHIGGSAFRTNQYGGAGDVQEEMYTDNLPISVAIAAKLGGGIHNGEFQYTQNTTEKLNNRGALLVRGIEHNGQIYSAIISVAPDLSDKYSPYFGLVNGNGATNIADPKWALYAKEIYKMYDNFAAAAKADLNQPIVLTGLGAGVFSAQSDEAKLIQGICLRLAFENHPELKTKANAGLLHLPFDDKAVMAGFNLNSNNPNFNNAFEIVNNSHKEVQLEKKSAIAPIIQAPTFEVDQLLKNYLNTNQNDLTQMGYEIKTFKNGMVIMDPVTKQGLYLSKLGEFGNPAGKNLPLNEIFKNKIINDIENFSVAPIMTAGSPTNQNITLSNTQGNQLAIKFPNQAAQQAFLASIGGQQFFPANDQFNAGKPCPSSIDETNHVVYFSGYNVVNGADAGSLGVAFANETMRNKFHQTLLANSENKYAKGYEGNATLYITALSPNSTNNLPIQINISQTTLNSLTNKNIAIKPHEQVVISPQDAQKHLDYMKSFEKQLDPNWGMYDESKLAGVVLNIQSALSAIAKGEDHYKIALGGMGRYGGISLPDNPKEALLYAMDENIYGQLPPKVKEILDKMRNEIVHKERIVDPRFVAEQNALNAIKPLVAYLSTVYANPAMLISLQYAKNDENRHHPLGATMEAVGFKITTARHGGLQFNLMNHAFSVDVNNINNVTVKLNFTSGQEQLNKIEPEKIDLLVKEMKSWQNRVNQEQAQASQQRAAQERAAQERAAQERAAQERAAQERAAQERAAQERAAQERAAQERAAQQALADSIRDFCDTHGSLKQKYKKSKNSTPIKSFVEMLGYPKNARKNQLDSLKIAITNLEESLNNKNSHKPEKMISELQDTINSISQKLKNEQDTGKRKLGKSRLEDVLSNLNNDLHKVKMKQPNIQTGDLILKPLPHEKKLDKLNNKKRGASPG